MRSIHNTQLPRNYSPHQVFLMDLTILQTQALSALLPVGYSLCPETRSKIKQLSKKKVGQESSVFSQSIMHDHIDELHSRRFIAPKSKQSEIFISKQVSKANKKQAKIEIKEEVKPMFKLLEQLKNYKHSWPFLHPVDHVTLGIPEYYQIVKDPMDLQTVDKKLKSGQYQTPRAFYDDINLIIKNSYNFNQINEDFLKITTDFQKYFFRAAGAVAKPIIQKKAPPIVQKPVVPVQPPPPKSVKKKKKAIPKDLTEAIALPRQEKVELAQQIMRLGKQHLDTVKRIVFDQTKPEDNQDEFDMERIGYKKIKQLQKFVKQRIAEMESKKHLHVEKKQTVNYDDLSSEEFVPFIQ